MKSVTIEELDKLNQPNNLQKEGGATDFNIMVCGSSGIGKTSFVDLFLKKFLVAETNEDS